MHENKIKESLKIKPVSLKYLDQYNELLRYVFQVTDRELEESGYEDGELRRSKRPILQEADVFGWFTHDDELVSQICIYPCEVNIHSRIFRMGGVTGVGTYPEFAGMGLMNDLIRLALQKMRKAEQYVSYLYPYSIPLYRNLGWEIISNKMTYTIKDTQVPRKLKAPGYVRRVAWDDKDFKELHTKFASKTHGCLYRNNLAWEEYFRWDEDDTVVAIYYSADDVPYGYMVYLISSDIMHIKEMIYLNREAQLGLWEYIHAHDSMIDEVKGNNYYSEPIAFELEDSDIKETIRPYSMGRIIDVVQFMEHYACDPDEPDVCIRFEIEDELLPWNNDSFTFFFEKGHCVPTDREPDHVMKMTIASLTTLLLGYKTASKLYEMARIETTPQTVECLDDLLFHHIPYVSDYI